jgi:hypothetical protein
MDSSQGSALPEASTVIRTTNFRLPALPFAAVFPFPWPLARAGYGLTAAGSPWLQLVLSIFS